MIRFGLVLAAAGVAATTDVADAGVQQWTFGGEISRTGIAGGLGAPFETIPVGTPWEVDFVIDTAEPGNGGGGSRVYPGVSAGLRIGGETYPAIGVPELFVFTGGPGQLSILFPIDATRSVSIFFNGVGDPLSGSVAIPSSIDLDEWVTAEAAGIGLFPQTAPPVVLIGDVTSFVIPSPATAAILVLGAAGVVRRR